MLNLGTDVQYIVPPPRGSSSSRICSSGGPLQSPFDLSILYPISTTQTDPQRRPDPELNSLPRLTPSMPCRR